MIHPRIARLVLAAVTLAGMACGSSPTAPDPVSGASVAAGDRASATLSGTSGGRTTLPVDCAVEAIELAVVASARQSVTVAASYKGEGAGCPAPAWSVSPYATHQVNDQNPMELLVFNDGAATQDILYVTAVVETPTADIRATLPIQFPGLSGGTQDPPAAPPAPGDDLVPADCAIEAIVLDVVERAKKSVTVEATYKGDDTGCPAPAWSVTPDASHSVNRKDGRQLVVFDDSASRQDTLYVTAVVKTPGIDISATLPIQFAQFTGSN